VLNLTLNIFYFSIVQDMGTIVLGKLESGVVCKGQTLTLMPNKVL